MGKLVIYQIANFVLIVARLVVKIPNQILTNKLLSHLVFRILNGMNHISKCIETGWQKKELNEKMN